MVKKRILSKSQINTYLSCPYKWKRFYIDKIKSKGSTAMIRGIKIHKNVEKFYDNVEIVNNYIQYKQKYGVPKKFIEFENNRLKSCGKDIDKYFKPLFQELKVHSEEMGMRGFIDAVYLNPKDDGLIIIDYKTGRYYPEKYDDYRFELAIYKELLEKSGKIDCKVKYWGIIFLDQNKLFFEEVGNNSIEKAKKLVREARKGMSEGVYPKKLNEYCKWCQFRGECDI